MEVCKFLDLRDIETGNSQILAELVEAPSCSQYALYSLNEVIVYCDHMYSL